MDEIHKYTNLHAAYKKCKKTKTKIGIAIWA